MWKGDRMKTISGIEFASEHNGTDVFRLIELAYEQGRKDGHNEQLGTNLAEVGTDLISRQALLDKFEPWLKVKDYNDGELNILKAILYEIRFMRSAQPETATVTIGRTKGGVTMWYECGACGEPIDICDCYCRKCGRKLKHE